MSATATIALIVGLIIAGLLLIYFNQWRKRQNDEQRRKINALSARLRQLDTMARSIPSDYVDIKILTAIAQAGVATLNEMHELEPKNEVAVKKEEWALLVDKVKSGQPIAPKMNPANEAAGKELRKNLQALFKFIERQIKSRKIEKAFGNQQLIRTQFFIAKSLADAHGMRANQAEKQQKYRVAIHHLHDAIEAYSRVASNPMAQQAITEYRTQITKLDIAANKLSQSKSAVAKTNNNTLSAQLDQMVDKEDEWKRKQDYDG